MKKKSARCEGCQKKKPHVIRGRRIAPKQLLCHKCAERLSIAAGPTYEEWLRKNKKAKK